MGAFQKYTNKLGQEYKVSTKGFGQGQLISKDIKYDVLGRKKQKVNLILRSKSLAMECSDYDDIPILLKLRRLR
jgi:hypothetical protein